MVFSRKSSTKKNHGAAKVSRTSGDSRFTTELTSFAKVTRLFTTSKDFNESQLFRKYKESIDLDLLHYLQSIQRHWLPAASIFLSAIAVSCLATTQLKPSYEAAGKLLFKSPNFNVVGNSLLPNSQEGTSDLKPLVSTQNPISTQMEVISSPLILQRAIDKIHLKDSKGQPMEAESLEKSLKLQIVGGADVLKITYKSGNAEEAAAIVNAIIDVYLENDVLINRGEARAIRQLMLRQIPANRTAVQGAEEALRIFKQKNNVVNLSEESKSAVAIVGNLNTQINNAQAELDQLTAQINKLRQQVSLNPQDAITASALSQSPAVKATLAELQEVERQIAVKRSQFKDSDPSIVAFEAKKTNLKSLLQEQVVQISGSSSQSGQRILQIGELRQSLIVNFLQSEVQQIGMAQKIASLQNSKATYEQRVKILPVLEQQQRDLERMLEVPQTTYQTLLKKVQELQVAENNNRTTAQVISKASVPKEPVPSIAFLILLLGALSGALLAAILIIILEIRYKSVEAKREKIKSRKIEETQLTSKIKVWPYN